MHLLYYGSAQIKFLHSQSIEKVLKDLSIRVCSSFHSLYHAN